MIKDDKKCYVCKKLTNHFDATMIQLGNKRDKYFCSEKCIDKFEALEKLKEKK